MADNIKAILSEWMTGNRDKVLQELSRFPALSARQITSDFRVKEEGAARGARGLPRSFDGPPDEIESDVVRFVQDRVRTNFTEYERQIELYDKRIIEAACDQEILTRVVSAGQNALADFRAQVAEDEATLEQPRRDAKESEGRLARSRPRNRLENHLPDKPTSRALTLVTVGIILIIETFANGVFFSQGSTGGLIGGFLEALSFSLVNAALAYAQGRYALRYMSHALLIQRLSAVLAFVGFAAITLAVNIAVAHFRDVFVVTKGHVPYDMVFQRVLLTPLVFADFKSATLMALGLVFHVGAVMTFYRSTERYPGYAEIDGRRRAAASDLEDRKVEAIAQLQQHRDFNVAQLNQVISGLSSRQMEYNLALQMRNTMTRDFENWLLHAHGIAAQVVAIYRECNLSARAGDNSPHGEHKVAVHLQVPDLSKLPPPPIAAPDADVDETRIQLRSYITAINETYAQSAERMNDRSGTGV